MEGQSLNENPTVKISLGTPGGGIHASVLVSGNQALAVEEAAVIGEALGEPTAGGGAKLMLQKNSPVTKEEASELQSLSGILQGEGQTPKGSIAAHVMAAADKHSDKVEIPINKDTASVLKSITKEAVGVVPHGSLAAQVQSLADKAAADEASRGEDFLVPAGPEEYPNVAGTQPLVVPQVADTVPYVGLAPVGHAGSHIVGTGGMPGQQ